MSLEELVNVVNSCEEKKKAIDEKITKKKNEEESSEESYDLNDAWDMLLDKDEVVVESAGDGLVDSLRTKGCVDIDYISEITHLSKLDVVLRLSGSIYQDPKLSNGKPYIGYVTRDEYLSGNLLKKLEYAEYANNIYHGIYDDNVKALKSVLPTGISYKQIYYNLASPWIPVEVIQQFVSHFFHIPLTYYSSLDDLIKKDNITGKWDIVSNRAALHMGNVDLIYGTNRLPAIKILERILNVKDMSVYDSIEDENDPTGKRRKYILNKPDTLMAEERANKIQNGFKKFIERFDEFKKKLVDAYNERYGYNVARSYDGSFLNFPNLNPHINLFDYQKNAVARIIFNQNTLLAHNVGTGKTYVMIASGEELLRMNISKKNLYVVPNNILSQWELIYKRLYPSRELLVVDSKAFTPDKYKETLEYLKTSDEKVVLMPYSVFDRIPLSFKTKIYLKKLELDKVDNYIQDLTDLKKRIPNTLQAYHDKLVKELDKLVEKDKEFNGITFEELGFTRLYVDEAHNYKNVPISTTLGSVKGINPNGSAKCSHMLEVCEFFNSTFDSGIIMATGTPITNSITDAYVFQTYLQAGELKLNDINTFDAWVSMFAENQEELEIDLDTSSYRVTTRFSKFHNLPELTQLLSHIADFYYNTKAEDLPIFNGYTDVVISKTKDLENYLEELSRRIDAIRFGSVSRKQDNMLKITTDGRKAALDLRLINPNMDISEYATKAYICAKNVYDLYLKYKDTKSSQIIFCDTSVPSDKFNLYDELRENLIKLGVKREEIAYIHNATTDSKKEILFKKVNSGEVRVLIGSTFKLGLGVNVQERLVAIHHLDVPWRPADMVQREGRIIRPGNTSIEVFIYRYIKEGSFDAYSWQLLETKQNFINELLSNSLNERTKEDIQDVILNYGEVKALAVGNPKLKEHIELKNKIEKLKMLDRRELERITALKGELLEIPSKKGLLKQQLIELKADNKIYNANKLELDKEAKQSIRKTIYAYLLNYFNKDESSLILNYQGFNICAPSNLMDNNLCLNIVATGNYYLKLGTSELGIVTRIDNFLDSLPKKIEDKELELKNLERRENYINQEIKKDNYHTLELEELQNRLDELGKELNIG